MVCLLTLTHWREIYLALVVQRLDNTKPPDKLLSNGKALTKQTTLSAG